MARVGQGGPFRDTGEGAAGLSQRTGCRAGIPGGGGGGGRESAAPPGQAVTLGEDAGGSEAQGLLDTEQCPGGDGRFPRVWPWFPSSSCKNISTALSLTTSHVLYSLGGC